MFKNVIIALLLASTAYFAWISLTIEADPLERAYQRYNHVRIYEDGSFTGEWRDGTEVEGCLTEGLCQD